MRFETGAIGKLSGPIPFGLLVFALVLASCSKDSQPPQPEAPEVTTVSSVLPLAGFAGVNITIKGENLDGSTVVSFGGATATLVSLTDEEIIVSVPSLAVSGPVTVQVADTTIIAAEFKVYQVYALVTETLGPGQYRVSVWHNGTKTVISQGDGIRFAYGLHVDGGDYYVAGSLLFLAAYWKNATLFPLSTTVSGVAKAIKLENGVVQIAGVEINGPRFAVKHWINGTGTFLTTTLYDNPDRAEDMEIKDGEVFIAGSQSTSNLTSTAAYWVDGMKVELSLPGQNAGINDLFIDTNGDVYAVGYLSASPYPKVVYWKNGVIHEVTNGTTQNFGHSIMNHDNVVHVVGYGFSTGVGAGCIWRDDVQQHLGGTSYATKLQIVDGDFFILCFRDDVNRTPAVWFNGRLVNLVSPDGNATADALVVKN